MDLFTLKAILELDSSEYEKKMSQIVKEAKEAGDDINEALGGTGGGTQSGTGGVTVPVIAAAKEETASFWSTTKGILASNVIQKGISLIKDFGTEAIEAASSINEVQNVVDQTFGASASVIESWSKSTAKSFGLSELQAKQFTGYLGSMLQTSGIDQVQSAQMAMNLAGLAGDIASFYNIGVEEAYQKIQSGMSGEREPLLRYGIDLGAESIEAYSGVKLSDLSSAEKFLARYEYLMDVTQTVQGDFARTENEFANASRTLENNITSAKAAVGEKIMPIITAGTNAANSLFDVLLSESTEDTIAGIDSALYDTVAGIEKSASSAQAMTSVLADYGEKSGLTAEQQKQWDAVASELIRTIPELGGMINLQTGEIEGGTKALEENIAAWEEAGKSAAQTSALEAKQEMIDSITDEITKEQGLLTIAQKEMEQHEYDAADIGSRIAEKLGKEFDGTTESFRDMMDSIVAYDVAESLGITDEEISDVLSGYYSASKAATEHSDNIAELQEKYSAVQESIGESSESIQDSVDSLGDTVTETFDGIGKATDSLVEGFDQSDAAYTNAYNTGLSAANGLSDAYDLFSSAADAYAQRSTLIGGRISGQPLAEAAKLAVGMDYVPYDDYPAYLHEGEAVLTKAEASQWRSGGSVQTIDYSAIGSAVGSAVRDALSGVGVYMGADRVGDLVTERVSRNIARDARNRRYQPV